MGLNSLAQRSEDRCSNESVGYEYTAQKVICGKKPRIIDYQVHVPPDVGAIKYSLTHHKEFKKFTYEEMKNKALQDLAREMSGTILRPRETPPDKPDDE